MKSYGDIKWDVVIGYAFFFCGCSLILKHLGFGAGERFFIPPLITFGILLLK